MRTTSELVIALFLLSFLVTAGCNHSAVPAVPAAGVTTGVTTSYNFYNSTDVCLLEFTNGVLTNSSCAPLPE